MKKSNIFLINLLVSILSMKYIYLISFVLIVISTLFVKVCLYMGVALLAVSFILCVIKALKTVSIMSFRSDDPEFNDLMDKLMEDPNGALTEIIGAKEKYMNLHGEDLLTLNDDDLFETIYMQNLNISEEAEESGMSEFDAFPVQRGVVYVLSTYDAEVQNGGLCQFFVNSSRSVAPYVSNCLKIVGAEAHRELYDSFIEANGIDVSDLDSFNVYSRRGFVKQTKRYDFDAFDDRYYELPPINEAVCAYIRANIKNF